MDDIKKYSNDTDWVKLDADKLSSLFSSRFKKDCYSN